ncbi:MarR family transcriptional regulator [Cystobacter fuscus]|uniref:MarR family winged helix-turn-helix transcriptional regulator n=1 Tax=Cystobacter fuscus TaxID=43 RepID=UPI002B2BBCE8|nr:MarR family transcriptional regulator [Cystobacter fuscus]
MSSSLAALGLLIKKVQHRHHRALDARLGSLGISLVQWNALREIDRNPGSSQLRLAELTFNSAQAFGTLTTRLMRLGLIERRPGEGRATVHTLTPKGKALLRQGRELHLEVASASFAPLDEDERAVLMRLLTKLLDAELPVESEASGPSGE